MTDYKLDHNSIVDLEDIKFIFKICILGISSDRFASLIGTEDEDTVKRLFKKWYKV